MIRKLIVSTLLLIAVSATAETTERRRSARTPQFPPCSMVTGTPAITFTRDDGATLAPIAERFTGIGYTYGLTVLDTHGTLLAWHKSDLMVSTDHGCSWLTLATFTDYDFPPRIVAAKGGRAYAWSDNRSFLVRYDSRGAVKVKQPADFVGFVVDPNDADHLRAGGSDGSIVESHDAGESWERIGALPGDGSASLIYRFTFDPKNIDHIVAGTMVKGAYYSTDGGKNWAQATGIGTAGSTNVFELAIAPLHGNVVWAEGIDVTDSVRHIWRSTDGGATYTTMIDQTPDVHLINGTQIYPHPTNRDVIYFVFGTYFQGYGTDLYRFDGATRSLTMTHNDYDDINAIAFSPLRPDLMYLGLESESGGR